MVVGGITEYNYKARRKKGKIVLFIYRILIC